MRALFILALILAPAAALADKPEPYPDFTFKRVGLPEKGVPRIQVQIDPDAEPKVAALPAPSSEAPEATSAYAWFWDEVSPGFAVTEGNRFEVALSAISRGASDGRVSTPRLDDMRRLAETFAPQILTATVGKPVSPALVAAVIHVESGGRVDAVSSAGAEGLMQLIPATAERFGVADPLNPDENIAGGVAFLSFLMNTFDKDPILVLAAYNAGENAVKQHSGVPPYAETRGYVPKVLAAWSVVRALCVTPPELITDGCVFQTPGAG